MRSFTVAERRTRLARRHFLCPGAAAASGTDVAARLVGLHGTDPATPYLSLWARVPGFAVTDLQRDLYDERTLVKHLAMRRTLWVIRATDLPAVQSAASERVAATERRRLIADADKAGLAPDGKTWLDTACAAVLAHLAEHGATSARDLRIALPELAGRYEYAPDRPWGGESPLAPRVLTVLGVRGDIVRGPNDGGWTVSRPRWVPTTDWLGTVGDPVAAGPAAAQLVRRWLYAFGPATLTDVKWWFGNTLTWARAALRDIGAVEVRLEDGSDDDATGWALPDDLEPEPASQPWAALLPSLDVTPMGWFDRTWYLGEHRPHVFDSNGNAGPTAWWNGRIVGGWGQDSGGRVVLHLLDDLGRDGRRALDRRAAELTEWLDAVRVSPRFPSPLGRASRSEAGFSPTTSR
ncbi:winged helix DNA-binding domain-containing protein [Mycolicibacterium arseniciresistens]|uniref:Winged helix DNA-binding domain-containing protein n=1 Tax=Mycolicibacterium arseniciresistens TaxID=3062257 RepID=A0ABT8UHJ0_9MYCO|nr:winged helix DNA-binding domain-containing protein [Mycolicibacterium arseniciresistens]MDO3637247.1 winged helix DNA-binding domain-containing protein [Mycolicibacterium arseniciresistens]